MALRAVSSSLSSPAITTSLLCHPRWLRDPQYHRTRDAPGLLPEILLPPRKRALVVVAQERRIHDRGQAVRGQHVGELQSGGVADLGQESLERAGVGVFEEAHNSSPARASSSAKS